jgi:hypothetical protein
MAHCQLLLTVAMNGDRRGGELWIRMIARARDDEAGRAPAAFDGREVDG